MPETLEQKEVYLNVLQNTNWDDLLISGRLPINSQKDIELFKTVLCDQVNWLEADIKHCKEDVFSNWVEEARIQRENRSYTSKLLQPYYHELKCIKNYSDIVSLKPEILDLLIQFEETDVWLSENGSYSSYLNDADASTSGHHKDILDAYKKAKKGESATEALKCCVYFCENGDLNYNLLDRLSCLSEDNDSENS